MPSPLCLAYNSDVLYGDEEYSTHRDFQMAALELMVTALVAFLRTEFHGLTAR